MVQAGGGLAVLEDQFAAQVAHDGRGLAAVVDEHDQVAATAFEQETALPVTARASRAAASIRARLPA